MAHIGLIQALQERGVSVKAIAGSSIGALVGALYAQGHSVSDMLAFFKETPLFKYSFLTIVKPGLIDTERYFSIFNGYFPDNSFQALRCGLFVAATNLQTAEEEIFSEGELVRPLLASAALPPVFSPVEIKGELFADGGIMNNFPSEPLQGKVDFVIGSNVSPVGSLPKSALRNSLQLTERVTSLMIYAIKRSKLRSCDLLLEYEALESIGVLDRKGIEKAYQIGYDSARKVLEKEFPDP